jgi:hypothetical protein
MQIPQDEPTVVFLIGFSSREYIQEVLPGLLDGLYQINTSSNRESINQSNRFILQPTSDELLQINQNSPCIHLVAYARNLKKQVFVIVDSIQCIPPDLRLSASHLICSHEACSNFLCTSGMWLDMENNTVKYF